MRAHSLHALWAVLAASAVASPGIARSPVSTDLDVSPIVRRDLVNTASFSWSKQNENLFDIELDNSEGGENSLSVDCIDCQTSGIITSTFHGEDLLDFLDSVLNISFASTSAYIDLSIAAAASGSNSINLWRSDGLPDLDGIDFNIGLVFYIDLVFMVSSNIDVQGGFEFTIPDGSWIAADLNGDIIDQNFAGAMSNSIPWEITSGAATLTVDLRLRSELGASFEVLGVGAEAQVGIYLNLLELVAELQSTDTCALEVTEFWDINAGAYANFDVIIDSTSFGAIPTASQTFWTGSTYTQCLDAIATTAPATIPTDVPVVVTTAEPIQTATDIPIFVSSSEAAQTATDIPIFVSSTEAVQTATDIPIFVSSSSTVESLSTSLSASNNYTMHRTTLSKHISSTITAPAVMHTSTVYATTVYTVTSCAASVIHCPATWAKEIVVTQTIDLYTTVCPVTEKQTVPTATTTAHPLRIVTITEGVTLSACPTPIVGKFTPPAGVEPPTEHTTTIHVHHTVPAKTQTTTVAFSDEVASETATGVTFSDEVAGETVTSIAAVTTFAPSSADNTTASATAVTTAPLQVTAGAPVQKSAATLVGAVTILVCLMML